MSTRRWLLTAGAAAALVGVPIAVRSRPVPTSSFTAARLADRVRASGQHGWSGLVQTSGGLTLPATATFANLGPLLAGDNLLRAWWQGPTDWRVDRIADSGETDLIRHHQVQLRWTFGSQRAVFSPVSTVRLPDVPDLLPPTLGRRVLAGVRTDEIARLGDRRIAGFVAAGLRLTPREAAGTIRRVDLWADPDTGLTLAIDLYGSDPTRPVLAAAFTEAVTSSPDAATTRFLPAAGMQVSVDQSVDAVAEADALTQVSLPDTLAGFGARSATGGPVGVYGRGPAAIFVLPLRGSVAGALRGQLRRAGARRDARGTVARVGPIGLLVTGSRFGGSAGGVRGADPGSGYLLTGTVTDAVLFTAAAEVTT